MAVIALVSWRFLLLLNKMAYPCIQDIVLGPENNDDTSMSATTSY